MDNRPILLVEDNPDDVALTIRAFEKSKIGNKIIVVQDGQEALDHLIPGDEAKRWVPAVVLLDVNLPRIDGIEVLRHIRGNPRTRLLPVVMLTTSNEERDIAESYRLGANSYVRKPVVFGDFVEAARVLGLYWLLINEPPQDSG